MSFDGAERPFAHPERLGRTGASTLPDLIDRDLKREINSGRPFDFEVPLADVAEGDKATVSRRAIKSLLRV